MPLSFTGPESFYTVGEDAWWTSVDKALKGAPRKKLFSRTEDGLEVAPLYQRRTDTAARALRADAGSWTIVQRIDIGAPGKANAQILEDLEGGADGIELVFAGSPASCGHGIRAGDLETLEALLRDVRLDLIDIRLDGGPETPGLLALMLAYLEKHGIDPASVRLSAGHDPLGWMAAHGLAPDGAGDDFRHIRDVIEAVHGAGSPARLLLADGRVWHDAGASAAQELALVLASATAYLRLLETAGLPPEAWPERISASLVADADQFGTIAKARAVRALWAAVLDGAGLPQSHLHLHMQTSHRMLTRMDPSVNMLRNTVAVFAAGVGGADSVSVLPHTLAAGLPDAFARRLARNTQSILLEESSLAKVMDPAAGSGAIEDRTETLCHAAWELFQEIEAAGGLAQALRQGQIGTRIGAAREALAGNIARRKKPITGVSEFPNLAETPATVLNENGAVTETGTASRPELPEPGEGRWFAALRAHAFSGGRVADLDIGLHRTDGLALPPAGRLSEAFENLRDAANDLESRAGAPAKVFLASLGSPAQFTARASWAANAFAAGGIGSDAPALHDTPEDLISAFRHSGAALACIVSSDTIYEDEAEDTARKLREAGARRVYLAGRPGEREESYRKAGIDTFLYAGCDLLGCLQEAHKALNAAQGGSNADREALK